MLLLFVTSRIMLTLIGAFSPILIGTQYGKKYGLSQHSWLNAWGVWDSYWYLDIAKNGYSAAKNAAGQANYAFFPLYPMLVKFVGILTNHRYFIAGVVLSNLFLLIACFLLYRLVWLESGKNTALNTITYLFVFPVSFIFSGVFTESLYLMLAIGCFYAARKSQWWLVGVLGCLLSLTRSLGVLILLPMLYEYLLERQFNLRQVRFNILYLLLIPCGLALFSAYNYWLVGDPFAFKSIQSASGWDRGATNPLTVILTGLWNGLKNRDVRDLIEASSSLLCLALLCFNFNKIRHSYLIFGFYSLLVPLSTGLESMPRYILPVFPLYILLARITDKNRLQQVFTMPFGFLQGVFMSLWACGFPIIV